jgi:hypothetical protein
MGKTTTYVGLDVHKDTIAQSWRRRWTDDANDQPGARRPLARGVAGAGEVVSSPSGGQCRRVDALWPVAAAEART